MSNQAHKVAARLLENETGDEFSPEDVVVDAAAQQRALRETGVLTLHAVLNARGFYHRTETYRSGKSSDPVYARRNGKTQTWKTRPGEFRIPMKYGLYQHFDITNSNAHEWSTIPQPSKQVDRSFYGPPPAPEFFDT